MRQFILKTIFGFQDYIWEVEVWVKKCNKCVIFSFKLVLFLKGKQHGKIYNALHKEEVNVITLTKEETMEFKSILESYKNDEIGWEGQDYNYIILFDDVDYMITADGFVIALWLKKTKITPSLLKWRNKIWKKWWIYLSDIKLKISKSH